MFSLAILSVLLSAELPKTGASAVMGAWGTLSRGNSASLDLGGKASTKYGWLNGNQLELKGETYYWEGSNSHVLKGEGSTRFDYQIIPHLKTFALSSAKMDEKKKISLEIEESGGLSIELVHNLFFETRTGYGYSDKQSNAVEHQWVAAHALNYYLGISDILFFKFESVFSYPLYSTRLKKYLLFKEGWTWARARLEVPVQKYFKLYVEVENNYYIPKWSGTKHFDLYTRFGFDVWWWK